MKLMRKLHLWLSLIVGVQLILWLASGLGFNLLDATDMRGNTYRAAPKAAAPVSPEQLTDPAALLAQYQGVKKISQISVYGQPAFRVDTANGQFVHYADSGALVAIDEALARDIAQQSYNGPGKIVEIRQVTGPFEEMYRAEGPLWRVQFDDELDTRAYISAVTGRVLAHRSSMTEWADLFFKLHFMDYSYEGGLGFNNWLVIVAALLVLWLGISGVLLVAHGLGKGQYALPRWPLGNRQHRLAVEDGRGSLLKTFEANGRQSLLDTLQGAGIQVSTACGGGGSCGMCRVRFKEDAPAANGNDKSMISDGKLDDGYRLSCQHKLRKDTTLEVRIRRR